MAVDPELLTALGAVLAIFLSASGSSNASSLAGNYAVTGTGLIAFAPIIISGVLAIYGIIVAILLCGKMTSDMTTWDGYRHLSAGLSVGLSCWASGIGMSFFIANILEFRRMTLRKNNVPSTELMEPLMGRRGATSVAVADSNNVQVVLCMIFLEAIGLYGLIVALVLIGH